MADDPALTEALKTIYQFVVLQRWLLNNLWSVVDPNVDELTLGDHIPNEFNIDDHKWILTVHGIGIAIKESTTGITVDAHKGALDYEDVFDAWRLSLYCESMGNTFQDYDYWKNTLFELEKRRQIVAHAMLRSHFSLLKDE